MATNNIILAVPGADTEVNYALPGNESATLSFSPDDIDGLKLNEDGGLVISFTEGGNVTLTNFQSFIDNGNTLSLSDGTVVDPKLLFSALGGTEDMKDADAGVLKIGIPAANDEKEIILEPGQKYQLDFDLSQTQGADVKDGKMIISFPNGGKIVLENYETAMAGENPPELSISSKTCVVDGSDLITNIKKLAASGVNEDVVVVKEEVVEETKPRSTLAKADMDGQDDTGPAGKTEQSNKAKDMNNVETAAGEPSAKDLANIETAAGAAGLRPGYGGYGFGSRAELDPFTGNNPIGPLGQTGLGYRAPTLDPREIITIDTPTQRPDGHPSLIAPAKEIVDETDLSGGDNVVTGSITVDFGSDGPGAVSASGAFTSSGSQTGGALTSNGQAVVVSVVGNSYVGTMPDGTVVFQLTINPLTGAYVFTQYQQLDHADGTDPNDVITLNFGVVATDSDGDSATTTITVDVRDDAPVANDDGHNVNEGESVTGNVTTNDVVGQDSPGTVISVTFNGTVYTVPASGTINIPGNYGTLTIDASGSYTYISNGVPSDSLDVFSYVLRDYDGDTDPATLSFCVVDSDTQPILVNPCPETVDETNMIGGELVETGTVVADFGDDAPGSISGNDVFSSSGSRLGGALSSNGTPVTVSYANGVYTGTAGGVTVFTLTIAANGDYTFRLLGQLDHADGTDPNDVITLNFGVVATDADGDSATTTITVNVLDDAPVAHDDVNTYDTTYGVANGNVMTGLNGGAGADDILSHDATNRVTKIAFNGTTIDVPATGTVSIDGQYGKLTISANGTYSYSAYENSQICGCHDDSIQDVFTYTIQDGDNDMSTATLTLAGQDLTDDQPVIAPIAPETIDETNLVGGVITETGTVSVNYGTDGVGSGVTGSGSFLASGSRLDGALTSGGVPVVVTLVGNQYVGMAGTVTVFTLDILSNGNYTFKLYEQFDHGDGSNPNDVITLDFGITATDCDGDTACGNIVINVRDDAPIANDDSRSITEGQTINGNVTSNDTLSQDTPNVLFSVTFGTQTYYLTANNTTIVGANGTLTINNTGAYTYVANQNASGVDNFTYILCDSDYDTDSAILSICVTDTDTVPTIVKPAAETVDETSLSGGTIVETGAVTADFKDDGPGSFAGNNSFSSTGSKLGGALTSNGVAVVVSYANGVYTAKAGSVTVFTLTINANGNYTYRQFEQLDHADGNNANDVITLNFGVVATDADGDSATTTITVNVKDDAPDAIDDGRTTAEGTSVTGNVMTNDVVGQDVSGKVTQVTINGVTTAVPATGTVTIAGVYGTLTIGSNGAYTYVAKANAAGVDNFAYTLRDYDGDTDVACLSICVTDTDTVPTIVKPAAETVDETSLSGGTIVETGAVTADFKDDGPGSFAGNNSFSSTGSKLGGALTSNGVAVVVSYANGVYTAKAGSVTVFTLTINANGNYTYRQFEQLDHADGNNANDVITLNFGVVATDADGDSATTTITVNVKDDAPDAIDDGRTTAEGTSVTGNVMTNDVVGQDVSGKVTQVTINGVTTAVPATGTVTIAGVYGTLTIGSNGAYTYVAKANAAGVDNFAYTLRDYDGDTDVACLSICVTDTDTVPTIVKPAAETVDETSLSGGTIVETGAVTADFKDDGPGSFAGNNSFSSTGSKLGGALTSNGVAVVVSYANGVYTAKAGSVTVFTLTINANGNYTYRQFEQLDHADGNNANDVITLNFGVVATDADGDSATTTITVNVKDDAPDAIDDGRTTAEGTSVTGNVMTNDVVGQDVSGKVTQVTINGVTTAVPATGTVTIAGVYGTLTIGSNGAYTYVAKANAAGVDNFAYTLRDYDGDTDVACLSICVTDTDTVPTIVKPAAETVDETSLSGGTIVETGAVTADFKDDGPGSFAGNNSFSSTGSKLGGALTSNGVAVVVSYANGVYTAKAGSVTVFTLTINANGNYTYRQFEQLDHADGNNANDVITLNFGVVATDADGDSATTTITVNVKDDAPDAIDDGRTTAEGTSVTGNVMTNDVVGQDVSGKVTQVTINGVTTAVPATGTVTIAGVYGTLTIGSNGAYTYVAKANAAGVDNFAYTLRDYDGDTDVACLSICVTDTDTVPTIVKPAAETVDETSLSGGTIVETGAVTADFKDDGPGSFAGNNSFSSTGSKLGGALTSNGVAVVVSYANGVYTAKAGSVTVFTLTINANGNYTYRQFEQLDHADGNNANDVITLNFGVVATDADGDSATTTITVNVKDDAPVACDDACTVFVHEKSVSSNALSNDTIGQDVAGRVKSISFGGTTYNVPATGDASITTAYGVLTIAANGAYTYTITSSNPPTTTLNFTVTIADRDGDTDTSNLQINILQSTGSTINGSGGDDTIHGTSNGDTINGNGGNDWLWGEAGNDTINGGAGNDDINAGTGNDTVYGGDGQDTVSGREGDDIIYGGNGNDNLYGDAGASATYGGNDRIYGEAGDDYISGGMGNDYIDGGADNDALYGNDGVDTILGGAGNDHLIGGKGNDILTGGTGADTFWFMNLNEGVDTIKDFSKAQGDTLQLSNVLVGFDPVTDAITNFVYATYSGGSTTIYVNADGVGGLAGATAVAVLEGTNLTITDLFNNGHIIV